MLHVLDHYICPLLFGIREEKVSAGCLFMELFCIRCYFFSFSFYVRSNCWCQKSLFPIFIFFSWITFFKCFAKNKSKLGGLKERSTRLGCLKQREQNAIKPVIVRVKRTDMSVRVWIHCISKDFFWSGNILTKLAVF